MTYDEGHNAMNESFLRNEFDSLTLESIQCWITQKRSEDLHLEFKQLDDLTFSKKDTRRLLSKAVSAFANADGGIVIWGIEKEKSGEESVAGALKPLRNPEEVVARLETLTSETSVPVVQGVSHRVVPVGDGTGLVATLVPASVSGPHMAKLGENRYYQRNGAASQQMEHFQIADMFGRRARPALELLTRLIQAGSISGPTGMRPQWQFGLAVKNSARGIARFPRVELRLGAPYVWSQWGLDGNGGVPWTQMPQARDVQWVVLDGGASQVVHAGNTVQLILSGKFSSAPEPERMQFEPLTLEYRLLCDGTPPKEGELRVEAGELKRMALDHLGHAPLTD